MTGESPQHKCDHPLNIKYLFDLLAVHSGTIILNISTRTRS